MDKQKTRQGSSVKENLIIAFILVSVLLVGIDLGKNVTNEIQVASEQKKLSTELGHKPKQVTQPTLSEEEMERWAERLEKYSE